MNEYNTRIPPWLQLSMKFSRVLPNTAMWMLNSAITKNFLFLGICLGTKCISLSRGG